jgi:hypothetical protein
MSKRNHPSQPMRQGIGWDSDWLVVSSGEKSDKIQRFAGKSNGFPCPVLLA